MTNTTSIEISGDRKDWNAGPILGDQSSCVAAIISQRNQDLAW
jgi:hypothetical protein